MYGHMIRSFSLVDKHSSPFVCIEIMEEGVAPLLRFESESVEVCEVYWCV